MRLLLEHDRLMFRGQFRAFYAQSSLPPLDLFAWHDRYILITVLSSELLDDIMPRIRRQLSLQADTIRLVEEAPTRGAVDWPRTLERGWRDTPGLPPLQFDTRLRRRSTATLENLFTVAVLLAYQEQLRVVQLHPDQDEPLSPRERQALSTSTAQVTRELAAGYARPLIASARQESLRALATRLEQSLRPGPSPYRDLLAWWRRFDSMRIGRGAAAHGLTMARTRDDERVNAWLYELWIALELVHLLELRRAIQPGTATAERDRLSIPFVWSNQSLRFTYNRQAEDSAGDDAGWHHSPGVRPDYTIERATPLDVRYERSVIWREPPVVMDAKYYLSGRDPARTHDPVKKLLGDMALLGASQCMLFFPLLPDPPVGHQITRTITRREERHHGGVVASPQVDLYQLSPTAPRNEIHARLTSALDQAAAILAARPSAILCRGVCLDADSVNASGDLVTGSLRVLCPKPHIGPDVIDLVDRNSQCLQDPRVCHVIGQPIVPPIVIRANDSAQLLSQAADIRARSGVSLRDLEDRASRGDQEADQRAEYLRGYIFTGIGQTVERYVQLRGNAQAIADYLERWAFGPHWQTSSRALAPATRQMLISGEYVWQECVQAGLADWAAPAIQYCRALELELRRRLYLPRPADYRLKGHWTLGTPLHAHRQEDARASHNWAVFAEIAAACGSSVDGLSTTLQRLRDDDILNRRNRLAHGQAVQQAEAEVLRAVVIGSQQQPGVLLWLVSHLDPVLEPSALNTRVETHEAS